MSRLVTARDGRQAGFTLIELLIVILIVGILAAVGVPLYVGYVRDAKLAEGKALVGSALTALQACAQTQSSTTCDLPAIASKVGVTAGGVTGDGRWTLAVPVNVTMSNANPPTLNAGQITAVGNGPNNDANLRIALFIGGTGLVNMRCNTSGTMPADATAGDAC
jgi:prepilin-type N-terminal cleavage/methylation domain-containing protein